MANLFNVAEVIDMGIEKEKKRRDFYGRVAENFSAEEIKKLFTELKDWEETHIKKFTEIRNSVRQLEATDSYAGELTDYINALVDDRLYREVSADKFSENVKDELTAIQYGIGFEKDAILFFREMLPYMEEANKDIVKKLIDEEKQHIIYLTDLKRRLKA